MDTDMKQRFIDLRSDTVTLPTEEMRSAMHQAPLGDDVFGEDPTVNELERMAAELLGKEASVYVPSGTMGNLAAILAHCGRGDEIILGDRSHTFLLEAGGVSAVGGIHPRALPNNDDGTIELSAIEAAIRGDDPHYPVTRLICLENTHNRCGGAVLETDYVRAVADIAHSNQLALHTDGARIFNASVALNIPVAELADPADSVTFCLSKALCAPVGSVLCGSKDFIAKARRARKVLGGGMRQAGVIAAAGIVALESMVDRLKEDHDRARTLAKRLDEIEGIVVEKNPPLSNMVFVGLSKDAGKSVGELAKQLRDAGVLVGDAGADRLRMVTHFYITDEDIEGAVEAFERVLEG
jgi:threonine aldolase